MQMMHGGMSQKETKGQKKGPAPQLDIQHIQP